MPEIGLPFGEWLPDLGENENPGLVEAKNVIASAEGYEPIKNLGGGIQVTPFSGGPFWGRFGYHGDATSPLFYVDTGRAANLYVSNVSTSVTSRSQPWHFARFDNKIFAVREGAAGASSARELFQHDIGTTSYSNVSVSGLRGRSIARVGRFLMLGGTNVVIGSSTLDDRAFRWSAFNDPLSWAVSQTTQAGVASINSPELGPITGIVGGRSPLIFQEQGVIRIEYVGPPKVWAEREISRDLGCVATKSIVTINDLTYFFSNEGVCVTNGTSVQNIGVGRVNKTVKRALLLATKDFISAGVLWEKDTIVWSFMGLQSDYSVDDNRTTSFNILYNYRTDKFSFMDLLTGGIIPTEPRYLGVSGIPAVGYALDVSDDPVRARRFDKTTPPITQAATMTTGYRSLTPGRRVSVNAVEPVYDGAGAKVAINTKATLAGAVTAGTPVAANSLGIAPVRADGRAAAVSVTFDAGEEWSEFKGAIVTTDNAGAR